MGLTLLSLLQHRISVSRYINLTILILPSFYLIINFSDMHIGACQHVVRRGLNN